MFIQYVWQNQLLATPALFPSSYTQTICTNNSWFSQWRQIVNNVCDWFHENQPCLHLLIVFQEMQFWNIQSEKQRGLPWYWSCMFSTVILSYLFAFTCHLTWQVNNAWFDDFLIIFQVIHWFWANIDMG